MYLIDYTAYELHSLSHVAHLYSDTAPDTNNSGMRATEEAMRKSEYFINIGQNSKGSEIVFLGWNKDCSKMEASGRTHASPKNGMKAQRSQKSKDKNERTSPRSKATKGQVRCLSVHHTAATSH